MEERGKAKSVPCAHFLIPINWTTTFFFLFDATTADILTFPLLSTRLCNFSILFLGSKNFSILIKYSIHKLLPYLLFFERKYIGIFVSCSVKQPLSFPYNFISINIESYFDIFYWILLKFQFITLLQVCQSLKKSVTSTTFLQHFHR